MPFAELDTDSIRLHLLLRYTSPYETTVKTVLLMTRIIKRQLFRIRRILFRVHLIFKK